jgi:hypothetical protein
VLITKHLKDGVSYEYREEDALRITPQRATIRYEVHAGDVVFMSRGSRNLAWAIARVPEPTIVPVSFYILRPGAEVDGRYLAWYLNQTPAQASIDQARTGAGTPIVQRQSFERVEVVMPPLATQWTIAELAQLQARERALRGQLGAATELLRSATSRQIIKRLRSGNDLQGRTS